MGCKAECLSKRLGAQGNFVHNVKPRDSSGIYDFVLSKRLKKICGKSRAYSVRTIMKQVKILACKLRKEAAFRQFFQYIFGVVGYTYGRSYVRGLGKRAVSSKQNGDSDYSPQSTQRAQSKNLSRVARQLLTATC